MRTRVKICGITRPEDGVAAARLGADAIGLVFYRASPRALDVARAREIVRALPPFVTVVGLFLDAASAEVRAVLDALPIDVLQFHGDEPAAACAAYGKLYIKAVPMGGKTPVTEYTRRYADAAGLLLDSHEVGSAGGSGRTFDWSRVPAGLDKPVILAGGLTPDNVAGAIRCTRPYGVDVSSGVEAGKGIKDPDKIAAFIRGVRSADTD